MMKLLVSCLLVLSLSEVYVVGFPNLFSGVLLPTPFRFFIPGLVSTKNGLCKSTYPKNNKQCMLGSMLALMTSKKDDDETKKIVETIYNAADNFGRAPHAPSGVPRGVTRETKLVLCYAATTLCECQLLKDWCKETVSLNELTRPDEKICEPQGEHPKNIVCRTSDGGPDSYTHSTSQQRADQYCVDLVLTADVCKDMSYARLWYVTGNTGEKKWRCYRNLNDEEGDKPQAAACMNDRGSLYQCETPVNDSAYDFCTRDAEIKGILGQTRKAKAKGKEAKAKGKEAKGKEAKSKSKGKSDD